MTGVLSFVLGHLSGAIVGVCLVIVCYKLKTRKSKRLQHVPNAAINLEVPDIIPDSLIYEDIKEAMVTEASEDVQLQENAAYGSLKK